MPRRRDENLTEVELQILNVLWDHGPSPVRVIHAELEEVKGTNYSTTVKMLSVMLQKDLVTRTENERPHVYRAKVTRRSASTKMIRTLANRMYDGSAMSLVMQAISTQKPTAEEIAEVRKLLDELESGDDDD